MSGKPQSGAKNRWRPAPAELIARFDEALSSVPDAERRQMFGYPCSFINGQMFAGLHQENMILRLSQEDRAQFLQIDQARPFEPMPGRTMKEYVVVPPSVLDSKSQLSKWLEKASAYARSLPPKTRKAKSARTSS